MQLLRVNPCKEGWGPRFVPTDPLGRCDWPLRERVENHQRLVDTAVPGLHDEDRDNLGQLRHHILKTGPQGDGIFMKTGVPGSYMSHQNGDQSTNDLC